MPQTRHGNSALYTRRELLEIGYSTALGSGLAALGRGVGTAWGADRPGSPFESPRAKSVLFIFLFGGPSHLDTFDPKPDAPDEVRGEFGTIASAVPGLPICEHLP